MLAFRSILHIPLWFRTPRCSQIATRYAEGGALLLALDPPLLSHGPLRFKSNCCNKIVPVIRLFNPPDGASLDYYFMA